MSRDYFAKRLAREQGISYTEALRRIKADAAAEQTKVTYAATIEPDQLQHDIMDTLLGRDDKP